MKEGLRLQQKTKSRTIGDPEMNLKQSAALTRILSRHVDEDGKIIPTDRAIERVETSYRTRPDAEKYRLAQAQTLLDLIEETKSPGGPRGA